MSSLLNTNDLTTHATKPSVDWALADLKAHAQKFLLEVVACVCHICAVQLFNFTMTPNRDFNMIFINVS